MRCFTIVVLFIGIFAISATAAMGQGQPVKQESALKTEDSKQLREQIDALVALLKAKVPQESTSESGSASSQTQSQSSGKTMADVLDKALDLVGGSVAMIASKVENAAPHVWRIMIFQQYAKAIGDVILPWGLLVIAVVYYRKMNKWWANPDYEGSDEEVGWWILVKILPIAGMFIFAIWGVKNFSESVKYLINPEYYAIKDLLGMVMGNVKI